MTDKPLHSGIKALLELGPTVGFVATYLIVRNKTFIINGTEYGGFIAVTALFIPVFLFAMALQWFLVGKVSRVQIATAVLVLLFGGLGVWLNDPVLLKMKPTIIYLTLAAILGFGLLKGQSWLEYIMEEMIPLKTKGWMILTKRVIALFLLSAAANELVWRTKSERFWVLFETLAMPLIVLGFFLTQTSLFVEYATFKTAKKKR